MCMTSTKAPCIAVIGAGAAGLMAAGAAREAGACVTLFEHNDRVGKKLRITGKGRCNLTNDCSVEDFLPCVLRNPRFLYTALSHFSPKDTMIFFEKLGVPLKTERGQRVFPISDKAQDVVDALRRYIQGVSLSREHITSLLCEENAVTGIVTASGKALAFDRVILATGGLSYPGTGCDGSGYAMAEAVGHTVLPLIPSLVPLESPDPACAEMMGLSLRNIGLRIEEESRKCLYEDFGELLFTHFGLSGPTVLSASAHLHDKDPGQLFAIIDLKPALTEKELDHRILSDFEKYKNKNFENALSDLLPSKMIPVMVQKSGISPEKKVNAISKEERRRLVNLFKRFTLPLSGFRPMAEAIVTAGGIKTAEVNPKTMESRKISGLFFAGEILDLDAYTGGYNLQIAFSTGRLAGICAANTD